jgi:hypothetical protein
VQSIVHLWALIGSTAFSQEMGGAIKSYYGYVPDPAPIHYDPAHETGSDLLGAASGSPAKWKPLTATARCAIFHIIGDWEHS